MKFVKKTVAFSNNILKKYDPIIGKCNYDNVFAIAGQSAFFIILSAVPLVAFCVSVLQTLNIPPKWIELALDSIFTDSVLIKIKTFFSNTYKGSVGISFISIFLTLWSAAQGMHAIMNGLNRVYNAYENRNWFSVRFRAMVYTVVFFAMITALSIVMMLGERFNSFLEKYSKNLPISVTILLSYRYIIIFLFLTIGISLIYRNFPCISRKKHKEYKFKYQLPGAILCTLSWFALFFGISIYVNSFNGFSVYGMITGFAIVMILVYFCMVSLMICAEINYVYHDKIKNFSFKKRFLINKNKKIAD